MKKAKAHFVEGDITDERLEHDFFFFVTYAKLCLRKLPKEKRPLGEKWLMSIVTRRTGTSKDKMQRNMHLSDLLGEMLLGNLSGIYAGNPPSRDQPLPPLLDELTSYQPPEAPTWLQDILGKGEEAKAVQSQQDTIRHRSKDGKTYVASKELPDGRGAMGFVALSMDEQEVGEGKNRESIERCTVNKMTWMQDEHGKWCKRTDV